MDGWIDACMCVCMYVRIHVCMRLCIGDRSVWMDVRMD